MSNSLLFLPLTLRRHSLLKVILGTSRPPPLLPSRSNVKKGGRCQFQSFLLVPPRIAVEILVPFGDDVWADLVTHKNQEEVENAMLLEATHKYQVCNRARKEFWLTLVAISTSAATTLRSIEDVPTRYHLSTVSASTFIPPVVPGLCWSLKL